MFRPSHCLALLSFAAAPAVQAFDFDEPSRTDLQVTAEYSSGRYGETDRTTILNVPFVLRHRTGRWTGQVEVPYLRVESVERVLPGIGAIDQTPVRRITTESGLGDIWVKLTFELIEFTRSHPGIDITLKVKTDTGDFDKGLGTGGTDVALQVEGFQALGPLIAFGHVGHRRTGDVPGFVPYKDPWYAEAGLFGKVDGDCDLGGFYTWRDAIGRLGPLSELTLYTACRDDHGQRVQLYASAGFKAASADFAVGLTYRYRF